MRSSFLLRLLLGIAQGGGFFEILGLDRAFLLGADRFDLRLDQLDVRRAGHRADAGAGAGLVHDVDGLVRQEPPGEIAVGKLHGGLEGLVGVTGLVVSFVLPAEPLEDLDRFVDARGLDLHGLETALESGVLLDVLAVLVEGGGADALKLAPGKRRLDDIRGVHGPFGGARADDGVQLVDEEDDVLRTANLVHDGLDPLFELAAVLGAGDHEGEVEGDDFLIAQQFGHVAGADLLGQSLDDGGLADAGLAQQDGIVFGAAAENLDDALDLVLPADDRVDLPLAGKLGEVAAEGAQRRGLDVALLLRLG